ncbi:type II secretion system F family protein [Lichenibacterium ramalinae]|uniref:Type II secretion system F family protein n=1 Tax=Lichenibacterium ramalinae TaxID=2316527 RepID=A0A4Q2RJI3_9HYPH|nr:type II secretion system F family protein [Lichenibacterium ramalinae]RYB07722.1 type II secretion system F family protein [Lichenibacterium ramalinae]
MMDEIYGRLSDQHFMAGLLAAIAAAATIITLVMPMLESDTLGKRMKQVSSERERIRARERDKMAKGGKANLRPEAKAFMSRIVEGFSASKWLGTDTAKQKLAMAGFRGHGAEVTFLFFRLVAPVIGLALALAYVLVLASPDMSIGFKLGIILGGAYLGIKAPEISLSNTISKRQKSLRQAFPDTLDLLLICVEAGMSLEHAGRKVASEIGTQSIPMAEEMTLTMAEMSYLPDRRQAFENFAGRTGLELVKSLATVMIQSEKYGTPLGAALRVLSQEGRDTRMMEAEKKAASLPPKLTVPMILFFLPVLFVIIGTPAVLQVMAVAK